MSLLKSDHFVTLDELVPGADCFGLLTAEELLAGRRGEVYSGHAEDSGPITMISLLSKILRRESSDKNGSLFNYLSRVHGKVLIDLGAGPNADGYEFANLIRARGYVASEPFFTKGLVSGILKAQSDSSYRGHIPATVLAEDMFYALGRLPGDSVCVLASNIDFSIIRNPHHRQLIECEIERVIGSDGMFINLNSAFNPKLQSYVWEKFRSLEVYYR